MERMNLEDLARLVDEDATNEERIALEGDEELRRELEALRAQTKALQDLPSVLPPKGEWADLERELVREGLIHSPSVRIPVAWLQVAAAVLLFAGGALTGRALPVGQAHSPSEASNTYATVEQAAIGVQSAEAQWLEAMKAYRRLSGSGSMPEAGPDPAARFAAIEALLAASQAAVRESPADPFFNNVLVGALAERDQTLRQIRSNGDNWY